MTHRYFARTTFILLFAISIALPAVAQKKIELTLDLKEGSEHKLITEVESKQFFDSTMAELNSGILIHLEADIKVLDKSKQGIHTIENTFTRITAKQNVKDQEFYYDTDQEAEEENQFAEKMSEEFQEMIDAPITIKLNNKGEIVNKLDSLSSRQDKAMKYFENYFIEFPKNKIYEGYTWQVKEEGDKMDGIEVIFNYTVKEVSNDKVLLSVQASGDDIQMDEEKSAMIDQFDLIMTGEMEIDPKTGITKSQEINQTMHVKAMVMEMHMKNSIRTWFEE